MIRREEDKKSTHILNIFIVKINRARIIRFLPHDSGTVKIYERYLVYRAHMNMRMRQFHGI
jgi:hypothetical protein